MKLFSLLLLTFLISTTSHSTLNMQATYPVEVAGDDPDVIKLFSGSVRVGGKQCPSTKCAWYAVPSTVNAVASYYINAINSIGWSLNGDNMLSSSPVELTAYSPDNTKMLTIYIYDESDYSNYLSTNICWNW